MAKRKCKQGNADGLGEVTKRDFVAIAEILCEEKATNKLKDRLAGYFRSQNARFDTDRFLTATRACRR